VEISREDDRGFEDSNYWVTLRGPAKSPAEFEERVDSAIARLLRDGHKVYRSIEEDSDHIVRVAYSLEPSGELRRKPENVCLRQTPQLGR
jgi:hypothetical protein